MEVVRIGGGASARLVALVVVVVLAAVVWVGRSAKNDLLFGVISIEMTLKPVVTA